MSTIRTYVMEMVSVLWRHKDRTSNTYGWEMDCRGYKVSSVLLGSELQEITSPARDSLVYFLHYTMISLGVINDEVMYN